MTYDVTLCHPDEIINLIPKSVDAIAPGHISSG